MNEEQQTKFKSLWSQIEELDDAARAYQKDTKKNQYHAMVADLKGLNITIGEAYKIASAEKVDFYEVFLDLLEKKVQIATLMVSRWY